MLTASVLRVHHASASDFGGAFYLASKIHVANNSSVHIESCKAGRIGGGFYALQDMRLSDSQMTLRNVSAMQQSGGFQVESLYMTASELQLQDAVAAELGGLFANGIVLAEGSELSVLNAGATAGRSGGIESLSLQLRGSSTVRLKQCRAKTDGGGALVGEILLTGGSLLEASNTSAGETGGGVRASKLEVRNGSAVDMYNVSAASGLGCFKDSFKSRLLHC